MRREKEFIEAVKDALSGICLKDAGGNFYEEIYADYRDELDSYRIKEIMESDDPLCEFDEKLFEWYGDIATELECDVIAEVLDDPEVQALIKDESEEAKDIIRDLFYIKYPDDHFLGQNICVDIVMDTGDANFDFVCNDFGPHYATYYTSGKIPEEASLLWLARQQGYTKTQLKKAMEERPKEKGFLQSVYDEINNSGSHMNELVFLVEMSFGEYLNLLDKIKKESDLNKGWTMDVRKGRGYIVLDKKVECGLFDEWSGGGSVLEIALNKDVKIPFKCIHKIKPDCCMRYSVKDVYGVNNSLWRDVVKEVHEMKRKER